MLNWPRRLVAYVIWAIREPERVWSRSIPAQWYHRARYGYGERDLWNLDAYIASILADACPRLKTADEDWNAAMDRMAELFGTWESTSFPGREADERMDEAAQLLAENFRGLWI